MWSLVEEGVDLYSLQDPDGRYLMHDISLEEGQYQIAARGERQFILVDLNGTERIEPL